MNTETKHKKFLTVYKLTAIALALISAALCAVCTTFFYDYSPGYFKDSTLCSVFSTVLAVAVVFALSSFFVKRKTFKLNAPDSTSSPGFISLIPACGFVFYAITIFSQAINTSKNKYMLMAHAIFALVALAYFLLRSLDTNISDNVISIIGLASVLCPMLIAIRSYFDYFSVMNSPEKVYLQITTVTFALYIINETRFILEEPYHRFYLALLGIILPISSCYTVNKIFIIANLKNKVKYEDIGLCVLMASIALYSFCRIAFSSIKSSDGDAVEDAAEDSLGAANNQINDGKAEPENPDFEANT